MSKSMKSLLIGFFVLAVLVAGVVVVYLIQKPSKETLLPSPTPVSTPVTPEVSEVVPGQACALTFTVTEEVAEKPVCDESCELTAQDCEGELECLVPEGETAAVCRNPDYPEEEDCLPPGKELVECNEKCDQTTLVCEGELECLVPENESSLVCRNPDYPEEEDCQPPASIPSSAEPSPSSTPSPSPSSTPAVEAQSELSCVAKRAFENDSRNMAGSYYLTNEITDTNTLSNGEMIVYNIVAKNAGDAQVTGVVVEDSLSANLTYLDSSSGCSYSASSREVTCEMGTIPANTEASVSIRVQIATASTTAINNTATVKSTDGQEDVCEISVSTTGQVIQPPSPAPSALPEAGVLEVTTGTLGIGVLLLILGTLGLLLL